jgi:mRNA interferase MazF
MKVARAQVWWVNLDPTIGSEIRKTRPAVIVSPDELNAHLGTVVVVPLTTGRAYPFRIATRVGGKDGVAAIDQVRTIDKRRLTRRIGTLKPAEIKPILDALVEMFTV